MKYKADYMVAETIHYYGEAKIALDAIKKYGKGSYHYLSLHILCSSTHKLCLMWKI